MSIFKNKHVITAMIVAPVLAIAAYYLTDLTVKEQPQPAVAGQSYALIAKSNCRFTSGECDLVNADFRSKLTIADDGSGKVLTLSSNHPLTGVTVGFVADDVESSPVQMTVNDDQAQSWSIPLTVDADENTLLRIAMVVDDSNYFAETTLGFSEYKTSFNKQF